MKITPEGVRLLANLLQQASEALRDMAVFLSSLAVEPEQTELPATGNSGGTTILTYPKELSEAAKAALASISVPVSAKAIEEIAKKLAEPAIEHSAEYLASKEWAGHGLSSKLVEVPPEDPNLPGKPEPITRQSLRALAEKLVAKGRLPDVKAALAKFGVTTLSALKTENYAAVQADFIKNGAS
jgi:hypothetical protein